MNDFIGFVVEYQALIREVINGVGMILFLTLTILVMTFMWDTFVDPKPKYRNWTHTPGIRTACALWWVFAAETYRTGAIWYLYNLGKHSHASPYPRDISGPGVGVFNEAGFGASFGYLIAGFMLCGGLLRCIYIFTPPEWKHRVWVYASIGAVVFVTMPSIISLALRIYIDAQ